MEYVNSKAPEIMIHPRAVGGLQGGLELEGRARSAGGERRQDCCKVYRSLLGRGQILAKSEPSLKEENKIILRTD